MNKGRKKNREYQHVLHNQFLKKNVSASTRPASTGKLLAKHLWVKEGDTESNANINLALTISGRHFEGIEFMKVHYIQKRLKNAKYHDKNLNIVA